MSLELLSIIGQVATGIGAISIAAVAYLHSRRSQRLEAINLYIGYWRELNRLFLESDRVRDARAKLLGRHIAASDDLDALCAIYVNQALVAYYTWRFGGLPQHELDAEFRAIWAMMARRVGPTLAFLHSESLPPAFVAKFEAFAPDPLVGAS